MRCAVGRVIVLSAPAVSTELKRAKVYLSDEGFGHIVRQRAIIHALKKLHPELEITLQTSKHIAFAQGNVEAEHFVDRFNNIVWHKREDSAPDVDQIRDYYQDYRTRSEQFIQEEQSDFDHQFVISDFVYEGFEVAQQHGIPSFGVAHFTWDWFFSKLYPPALSNDLLHYFFGLAHKADTLFFPPFTPPEILQHYQANAMEVPFIVRSDVSHKSWPADAKEFKILIMDSGAGLVRRHLEKAIEGVRETDFPEVTFGVMEGIEINLPNVFRIPKDQLLVDYVQGANLIIGRPGFNTISECIAFRVPMLLVSESMNPEMEHNVVELEQRKFGYFVALDDFHHRFREVLEDFLANQYDDLAKAMRNHDMKMNGAERVAEHILNRIHA